MEIRVNQKKLINQLQPNMLDEVMLPECDRKELRNVAENLLAMIPRIEIYRDYHNITQLDKILAIAYWTCFDRLHLVGTPGFWNLETWFMDEATSPDLISRARRWLMPDRDNQANNYIIIKQDVFEAAMKAEKSWRSTVKH